MRNEMDIIEKTKYNRRHRFLMRGVRLTNIALMTIPSMVGWDLYYSTQTRELYFWRGRLFIIFLFVVLYTIFSRVYNALHVSISHISELVYSQMLALGLSDAIMYMVYVLLGKGYVRVWPMVAVFAAQLLISVAWSSAAHWLYFKLSPPLNTIVVWDKRQGVESLFDDYGLEKRFRIKAILPIDEVISDMTTIEDAEAVFLCGIHSHQRNTIIKQCVAKDIRAYVIPRVGDMIMSGARPIHLFHLPMLLVRRYNPSPEFVMIKRAFDILFSGLGLVIASPLMLIVALLIRRDGGTVFYRQKRLTKNGKVFEILKFRSMRMDAEKDGVARLSTGEHDSRITPVGRVIRACRLDELPQLWNIFVGDMSFIGPRPERPEIAEQYERELPEFSLRLQAKAGLTGYAQVYGKYNSTPYDKLLMDLRYLSHPSIAEDLKILFATLKILFLPESTEGVKEDQTIAMDT